MKNSFSNFQLRLKSLSFFLLHSLFSNRNSLFIFISLLVLPFSLHSQHTKIDSLISLLKKDKEDTNKVNHFNALGWEYKNSNPDTSIVLSNEALSLSQQIKWEFGVAFSYHNLGWFCYLKNNFSKSLKYYSNAIAIWEKIEKHRPSKFIKLNKSATFVNKGLVYGIQGDYSNALYYFFKSMKIDKELNNKRGLAILLGNIANVYTIKGNYPRALYFYFKALKMREELGAKDLISSVLGNIGIIYHHQGDQVKELEYYLKALTIFKEIGDKHGIALMLGNIGIVYDMQGDYINALKYYFEGLKIDEEIGNKSGSATKLGNIGLIYQNQKKYPLALEYYFKGLKIDEELDIKSGIAIKLGNIGILYTESGKYGIGEGYLIKALKLCDSIGIMNEYSQFELFLSHLYDTTARWQLAYEHYKKYSAAKDTLFNEEKSKDIGRLEQKHEYEMAELKRQQEEKEKSRQSAVALSRRNTLEYSAILLGIFALFVIVFFVARFNLPQWAVELAVFIPFLILFEFVLVLFDPYLEQITGGEPIWKLLVNAMLAAVIFPVHGYFERMLKKRIGRRLEHG